MTENLKRLLRVVYSVDTRAGHRLRYHIVRALACPDYAAEIGFEEYLDGPDNTLSNNFLWGFTLEGVKYWDRINMLIDETKRNGEEAAFAKLRKKWRLRNER